MNLFAPGGGTATGMVPDDLAADVRAGLLEPPIMGPPIRWLASAESDGITDCRIIAADFAKGIRPTAGCIRVLKRWERRKLVGSADEVGQRPRAF